MSEKRARWDSILPCNGDIPQHHFFIKSYNNLERWDSGKLEHAFWVFLEYDVDLLVGEASHAHKRDHGCQEMVVAGASVATQVGLVEHVV